MGLSSEQFLYFWVFFWVAFVVVMAVIGSRRWKVNLKAIERNREVALEQLQLSKLASDDRKEMLLVLREIKTLLEDRKS